MAAYGATLEGGVKEVKREDGKTFYAVKSLLSLAGYRSPKDTLKQLKEKLEARGGVVEQLQVGGNSVYTLNAVALSNLLDFLHAPAQSAVEALQARLAQSGAAGAEEEEEEADEVEDEEEAEAGTGPSDADPGALCGDCWRNAYFLGPPRGVFSPLRLCRVLLRH
jgi:ribosomal protein L12E/L44/L45/RPP1/RPP2